MKIAQVLPSNSWGDISPEALERGMGGREGALVRLSAEWAKLGHEVTNFVPTRNPTRFREEDGFHEYVGYAMAQAMLSSFEYDACVAWECPSVYNHQRITGMQPVRLVEMQCAALPSDEDRVAANVLATGVITLSEWHRDYMLSDGLEQPADRLHVLPNCVDLGLYPERDPMENFDRFVLDPRFVYSSSPDRGLWHLLRMWPRIRARWPKATLDIAYGMKDWANQVVWFHNRMGQMALELLELVSQPGVNDLGKIGQRQLAQIQGEATAWLYPCDTIQPTETGCITAIEAFASYSPAIMTSCDCLGEEFSGAGAICTPMPYDEDEFFDAVEQVLDNGDLYEEMSETGRVTAESRQWKDVAPKWIDLFEAERNRS